MTNPSPLEGTRVLLLSSSYEPIRIVSWQRAMLLFFSEKIEVLDHYGDRFAHSVSKQFQIPSVARMTQYFYPRRVRRRVRFTRQHVFVRDDYRCQYCQQIFVEKELTMDHVMPVVLGGKTSWANIVTCCVRCNQKKGGRTPQEAGLKLFSIPKEPQMGFLPDLIFYRGSALPEAWKPFIDTRSLLRA